MLSKNDIITLEIVDLTAEAMGVGRHEGMAVFVPMSAVGDKLSVRIVKVQKNLCYGIIEEILTPSPMRIDRTARSTRSAADAACAISGMTRNAG